MRESRNMFWYAEQARRMMMGKITNENNRRRTECIKELDTLEMANMMNRSIFVTNKRIRTVHKHIISEAAKKIEEENKAGKANAKTKGDK